MTFKKGDVVRIVADEDVAGSGQLGIIDEIDEELYPVKVIIPNGHVIHYNYNELVLDKSTLVLELIKELNG